MLSTQWPDQRVTSAGIAEEANIPAHCVSKVMRRLVLAGLVDARRGHHGGFQRSRPPETIAFIDVLEAVDFQTEAEHCAFGLGRCNPASPRALHPAHTALNVSFQKWARNTTPVSALSDALVPPVLAPPD